MSEEMAIGEKTSNNDQMPDTEGMIADSKDSLEVPHAVPDGPAKSTKEEMDPPEDAIDNETSDSVADKIREKLAEMESDQVGDVKMELNEQDNEGERGHKRRASTAFSDDGDEEFKGFGQDEPSFIPDYNRIVENVESGVRRKSTSSENGEEFKGFESSDQKNLYAYNQALERLEAELSEAVKGFTPLKTVTAVPATARANKRARQETEGSRPSSALSSRSEGEAPVATDGGRTRRPTTEMSAPQLRAPLERGWRRELVYRAALDAHSRRVADIYYYTPAGKKLRSMREVAEVLSGTGLTTENFSFFKEPLGIDDPEKEIIRDAKLMRRVESPVPAAHTPVVEGKRTPKPKPPKGASPEPATPKSPPAKLKVKSVGSRLSSAATATPPTPKQVRKPQPPATPPAPPPLAQMPAPDNNNTPQNAVWKKPRGAPPPQPRPAPPPAPPLASVRAPDPAPAGPAPSHVPLANAPPAHASSVHAPPAQTAPHYRLGAVQQPCSMACGRGAVPSLACAACLCLYHPACVGAAHMQHREDFLCKNCRKSSSPPLEPSPMPHKSAAPANVAGVPAGARRMPVPVPVPVPAKVPRPDKRPLSRMKASGTGGAGAGGPWAAASGPQSLAVLNGRRFIVVARPANT